MLRRLWLIFAQATTVGLAVLFVVATLKPEWLSRSKPTLPITVAPGVSLQQTANSDNKDRATARNSYADAAKRAIPAVVSVYSTKELRRPAPTDDPLFERFFGERFRSTPERVVGLGSGVIATADGYVLTNNHVVEAAEEIAVALSDGRRVEAKLIGADPETDLAVLKVDMANLPAVTFGRSDTLKVGDVVLAIGNPFNVGQTVTMGIVSAVGRSDLRINSQFEDFIQTDAAINQGNSGGALIDTEGNLVGINTAIYSRTGGSVGIGFAIPATIITQVMEPLIKNGKFTRGYFGIEPEEITPELAETLKLPRTQGVVIRGVQRTAPAGKAGLEPFDVMVSINDQPIVDTPSMLRQIAGLTPGSTARVKVLRTGKETDLNVVVGERPPPPRVPR